MNDDALVEDTFGGPRASLGALEEEGQASPRSSASGLQGAASRRTRYTQGPRCCSLP